MEKLNLKDLSVLIVSPNQNMGFLVRAALKALGVGVVTVEADHDTAMQLLAGTVVDIVVCDLDSADPANTGLAFVNRLRSQKESPHPFVPIILMSANTTPEIIGRGRDAGADEFLAKPVSPTNMYRHIVEVVTKRRDFVRTRGYFGPDRHRHAGDEYDGVDRRKTAATLDKAEAGQFEKEGGQRATQKYLD